MSYRRPTPRSRSPMSSVLHAGAQVLADPMIGFDLGALARNFWALTIDGLTYGSIYALVAVGYTLVYGVLRLINFAHSEIFMLGMFGVYGTLMLLGFTPSGNAYNEGIPMTILYLGIALIGGMIVAGGSAVGLERVAYRPAAQARRTLARLPHHRDRRLVRHPGVRALRAPEADQRKARRRERAAADPAGRAGRRLQHLRRHGHQRRDRHHHLGPGPGVHHGPLRQRARSSAAASARSRRTR